MRHVIYILATIYALLAATTAFATAESRARLLWDRLVGSYSSADAGTVTQMAALLRQNKPKDAAALATRDKRFIDFTIRRFATPWSNRGKSSNFAYNGMVALVQGVVRDGLLGNVGGMGDFRTVFYGDFQYEVRPGAGTPAIPPLSQFDDAHFQYVDTNGLSAYDSLARRSPQWTRGATTLHGAANGGNASLQGYKTDFAGVYTVAAAKFLYDAGTNRRPVEWTFQTALCREMPQVLDVTQGDRLVARDIDRSDINVYQSRCIGCHGTAIDAMRNAFAYIDFDWIDRTVQRAPSIKFISVVAPKYSKNAFLYPEGHATSDDSWENFATANHNAGLGWRGALSGSGVQALGQMFANSEEFSRCMGYRVFRQVCLREPTDSEKATILKPLVVGEFENAAYNLHKLYEAIGALKECTGE